MTMSMVQTGTWTVKDDKITLTQTSALMNGSPMGPQTMPPQDYTFKREGDSITITPPVGNPVTLTRVKG